MCWPLKASTLKCCPSCPSHTPLLAANLTATPTLERVELCSLVQSFPVTGNVTPAITVGGGVERQHANVEMLKLKYLFQGNLVQKELEIWACVLTEFRAREIVLENFNVKVIEKAAGLNDIDQEGIEAEPMVVRDQG